MERDDDGPRDEVALAEARRIVDDQVSTARAYEKRAGELLKIFLTVIGITATVVLVLLRFTPQETTFSSFYTNSLHPQTLSSRLESALGFLSGILPGELLSGLATLLSTVAIVGLVVVFYKTATAWAAVADAVREIYEPRQLAAGVRPDWGSTDPIERYAALISENERELGELQDAWGEYTNSLFGGLWTFGVFIVLLATFSVPEPIATAYGTAISTLWSADTLLANREKMLRVRDYVFLELPDVALVVVFVGLFYFGLQPDASDTSLVPGVLGVLTTVSLFAYPFLLNAVSDHSLQAVSLRNLLAFIAAFVALVVYEVVSVDGVGFYGSVDSMLLTAAACSLLAMGLSLLTQVVNSVRSFAETVTE